MKRENLSRKRQAILQALCSTTVHPTAEWVYQTVKPQYPDLSLGTVYRNISKFKEEGIINSVGVVNGQERFDGNTEQHSHFICNNCGAVLDISEQNLSQDVDRAIADRYGLQVVSHELVFRGVCKKCQQD